MPKPDQPSKQYKAALYALKCGDRSFAEYYVRNQLNRSRSAAEEVDILDKLGWLTPAAKIALGLAGEQLSLDGQSRVPDPEPTTPRDRQTICAAFLEKAGTNGLKIGSLVSIVGEEEGVVSSRDRNWRRPVMAEVDEYADRGIFARHRDRLYLPEYAPQPEEKFAPLDPAPYERATPVLGAM